MAMTTKGWGCVPSMSVRCGGVCVSLVIYLEVFHEVAIMGNNQILGSLRVEVSAILCCRCCCKAVLAMVATAVELVLPL